jgi:hypothetical protein
VDMRRGLAAVAFAVLTATPAAAQTEGTGLCHEHGHGG